MKNITLLMLVFFAVSLMPAAAQTDANLHTVANNGWSNNSVNTVIFRKNSLTSYKNEQYISYYDSDQYVVLAKRSMGNKKWTVQRSQYKGDATDAHKSISIIVDGGGYLHVAWGQHNNKLNYAKAIKPGSLILGDQEGMLGIKETKVSYPEFYKLADGDLLFLYRDGGSGNGDMMINRYSVKNQNWKRIQDNLIDGQGKRNAYWQTAIDKQGTIHLSWVWRESPDVASNHDLCYAKSTDGGLSWTNSGGQAYSLPINAANAEYAYKIPQNSELINQTSMSADDSGNPIIAGYWRDQASPIPQYHVVIHNGKTWSMQNLGFRTTNFSLSGSGTKRIPISRPQILTWNKGGVLSAALIFRDAERGSKVSIAISSNILKNKWQLKDLTNKSVGEWEPTFDPELWKNKGRLNLFVQYVEQVDGEGKANREPTDVQILEWKP